MSELISADTKIDASGAVHGTLHYVENWTQFSPSDPTEQSGNFFPLKLDDKYTEKKITVTGTKTKTAEDLEWVLRVKDKNSKFTFKADQEEEPFLTLTFTEATFSPAPVI